MLQSLLRTQEMDSLSNVTTGLALDMKMGSHLDEWALNGR